MVDFPNDLWAKYYMSTANDVPGDPTIANGQDYNDIIDELRATQTFVVNTHTDNAVGNSTPIRDTAGWTTYADAAGATPVDGIGGVANITWARSSTAPLSLKYNFLLTKDAVNRQGEGVAYAMTLPLIQQSRTTEISFEYQTSGAYASGDLQVFVYDVTGAQLITPANTQIAAGSGVHTTTFNATSSSQYRLIFHVASTNAGAWTVKLNRVRVGREVGLDPDLVAIAALGSTGYARRSNTNTWVLDSTIPWSSVSSTPTTRAGYGITDAAANGSITTSGLTMNTARILGRTTASAGAVEEITIGAGLTLSGGILSYSGGATIAGSISAGQVAYGSGANTIAGSDDLTYSAAASTLGVKYLQFDTTATDPTHVEGKVYWNLDDHTLNVMSELSGSTIQLGQESWLRIVNKTGAPLTNGQVVYVNGAQGNRPTVALAQANSSTADRTLGVVTHEIADNQEGYITVFGLVRDINTSGFAAGDALYVSSATPGLLTNSVPTKPDHAVRVGYALNSTNNGSIMVAVHVGQDLDSLHDVALSTPVTGQYLKYNGSTWVNSTISTGDVSGIGSYALDSAVVHIAGTETITGSKTFTSGVTVSGAAIDHTHSGGVVSRQAATQDGIQLLGRAGGTSSYVGTLTPTTLTASRTWTFPDATGTVPLLESANVFTGVVTVPNGTSAAPGLRLTSEQTGLYRVSSTSLGFSVNGTAAASLTSDRQFTVGSNTGYAGVNIDAATGNVGFFRFVRNAQRRWDFSVSAATESGGNAGSDFSLAAFSDTGVSIDTPISIVRASGGAISIARPLTSTGVVTVPNGTSAAPGLRLTSEQTGLYRVSSTSLGFSVAGTASARVNSTGMVGATYYLATGSLAAFDSASGGAYLYYASGAAQLRSVSDNAGTAAPFVLLGSRYDFTAGGVTRVLDTTASTSTTTGALVVSGGVGVGGAAYIDGTLNVGGAASNNGGLNITRATAPYIILTSGAGGAVRFNQTGSATSQLQITNSAGSVIYATFASAGSTIDSTTASTSTTTGALVVSGGVGVAGAIYSASLNVVGTTTLATSLTGLLKATSGVVSAAVAGTDYVVVGHTHSATDITTGTLDLDRLGTGRVWDHTVYRDNVLDTGWNKLATIVLGTGLYVGVSLKIEVIDCGNNIGSVSSYPKLSDYFVTMCRSGGIQDDQNGGAVWGSSTDYIRLEKVSTGNYEVHCRTPASYRRVLFRALHLVQNSLGSGGSLTWNPGTVAGTGTGTIYEATTTRATMNLQQVVVGTGVNPINGTTFANGWLQVGTSTSGWTMDGTSLYGSNGASASTIGTMSTGSLVLAPGSGQVFLRGNAGSVRDLVLSSGATARWILRANDTAESGSDAGSNLEIVARTDAGGAIDSPLSIVRAAGGAATFSRPVVSTQSFSVTNTAITAIVAGNGSTGASFVVNAAAGTNRDGLTIQSGGVNRWMIRAGAEAETGSNAGSTLYIVARDDAGVYIDTPVGIVRAAGGTITLYRPTVVTGSITASNGSAAAPGIRLTSEASGLYRVSATTLGVSIAGASAFSIIAPSAGFGTGLQLTTPVDADISSISCARANADLRISVDSSSNLGANIRILGSAHAAASTGYLRAATTVAMSWNANGITVLDGSAAAPGIRVTSEATGLYRYSSTELGFAVAGAYAGRMSTTALSVPGSLISATDVLTGNGSAASPAFRTIENHGLYRISATAMGFSVAGTSVASVDSAGQFAANTLTITNSTAGLSSSFTSTAASSSSTGSRFALRTNDGAAMASGDCLGGLYYGGITDGSNYAYGASIEAFTSQAWSAGVAGTSLVISVSPSGGTTRIAGLTVASTGISSPTLSITSTISTSAPVSLAGTSTLTGSVTDSYQDCIDINPGYTGAFNVGRHNYINLRNPTLAGSATLTDAFAFRFDAAAGTHKALAAAVTSSYDGALAGAIKVNFNGTVCYVPVRTSVAGSGLLAVDASGTGSATFRIPHGTAPSAPVNGDIWTTTAGLYARINGGTVGPFGVAATPAGSGQQVQYNDNGSFGASANLTFNGTRLTVDNSSLAVAVTASAANSSALAVGVDPTVAERTFVNITQPADTSGSADIVALRITGGAHTGRGLVTNTTGSDLDFNFSRVVQFATGSQSTTRCAYLRAPTYAFVGASTIDTAVTLAISGSPAAGTNATITTSVALDIESGLLRTAASTTTVAGLRVPHGTAPSAPVNGDIWTTASGLYARINGTTRGPYGVGSITGSAVAGAICVGTGTSSIGTLTAFTASNSAVAFTQTAQSSSSPIALRIIGGAHTALAASTEASDIRFDLARTVQFSTGALTTQRAIQISAPTYAFQAPSVITTAATVSISGAPVAGTFATITTALALDIVSGCLRTAASTTTVAGLRVPHGSAPTSPVDGDFWTTTGGVYARINGVTVGPLGSTPPAGSDTQIQYNDAGAFGASSSLTLPLTSGARLLTHAAGTCTATTNVKASSTSVTFTGNVTGASTDPIAGFSSSTTTTATYTNAPKAVSGYLLLTANPGGTVSASTRYYALLARAINTTTATAVLGSAELYGAEIGAEFYNSNSTNLITLNTLCGARVGASLTTTHSSGSQRVTFVRNISTGFSTSTQSGGTTTIDTFADLYLGGRDVISGSGTVNITNYYGIYQADSAATNWFNGYCALRNGAGVLCSITNLGLTNSGLSGTAQANFSSVANGTMYGVVGTAAGTASSTYTYNTAFVGVSGSTQSLQSGTSTSTVAASLVAIEASCGINSAATAAAAIVTDGYGVKINKLACYAGSAGVTFTTYYGLFVDAQSQSLNGGTITITNLYGIYQAGSSAQNYFAGDIKVQTAGKGFFVKEGSNAKMGIATLVAGTVTVSTTAVGASSRIFLTSNADGGTPGTVRVSARSNGTSFTITSSSGSDTSQVAWVIFDPA